MAAVLSVPSAPAPMLSRSVVHRRHTGSPMQKPMDIKEAQATILALATRPSYERARAEAMGFTFGPVRVLEDYDFLIGGVTVEIDFRCVCGTPERLREVLTVDEIEHSLHYNRARFDLAARLRQLGSFDRAHLLADGYAPSKVDEIIAKGEAFDEQAMSSVTPRRTTLYGMQAYGTTSAERDSTAPRSARKA